MTDDISVLFEYRRQQAEETLRDSQIMLAQSLSPRSIINRAYYAVFYGVQAIFLKDGIEQRTSKHSGLIAMFDKEIVRAGKCESRFSKILHRLFDARQESDYTQRRK